MDTSATSASTCSWTRNRTENRWNAHGTIEHETPEALFPSTFFIISFIGNRCCCHCTTPPPSWSTLHTAGTVKEHGGFIFCIPKDHLLMCRGPEPTWNGVEVYSLTEGRMNSSSLARNISHAYSMSFSEASDSVHHLLHWMPFGFQCCRYDKIMGTSLHISPKIGRAHV